MLINLGTIAMFSDSFELVKEDATDRVDQSYIYDLRIYRDRGYRTFMFTHKEDRDAVYDDIVQAMESNKPYAIDLFEMYSVKESK